jgi:hypothetical protein
MNKALFQATQMPPEAPTDGKNSKESKLARQAFLKNCKSKLSLFVSWKHRIPHPASTTLSLTAFHFQEALMPLTFHESTFQHLKEF